MRLFVHQNTQPPPNYQPNLKGPAVIAVGVGNPPAPGLPRVHRGVFWTRVAQVLGQVLASERGKRASAGHAEKIPPPRNFFDQDGPWRAQEDDFCRFCSPSFSHLFFIALSRRLKTAQDATKTPTRRLQDEILARVYLNGFRKTRLARSLLGRLVVGSCFLVLSISIL